MTQNWPADLRLMHDTFGHSERLAEIRKDPEMLKTWLNFRVAFLDEEHTELHRDLDLGDYEGVVDAMIDYMVVAIGTLDGLGVDTQKAWDAVQAANMAKQAGSNPNRPNAFNLPDLIKPAGWQAPSHVDNLASLETLYPKTIELQDE